MTTFQKPRLAVKRAIFMESGPENIKRGAGEAKPLRPQAKRLQKELASRRLRHHYLTAQACLMATLVFWLFVPLLPSSSQILDMSALRLSFYIIALMTLIFGLFQAWAMTGADTNIAEI